MSISIGYVSRRSEFMNWYWRTWRRRLWRTHLLVFVMTAFFGSMALFDGLPATFLETLAIMVIGLVPIAGFVLFPIVKFKPQERTLTAGETGIDTTIGHISKQIPWTEVAKVDSQDGALIIQGRNLNAFIVPARAFKTHEAKKEFRDFVISRIDANGS